MNFDASANKYSYKNTGTDLGDIKNTVYSSMKNLKILHEMNRIVLNDISKLYSGIELKKTDNGENACQRLTASALDQCVSNKAQEYRNQIRNKKDVSSYVKKVEDLYYNSAYSTINDCDKNNLSDKKKMENCLRDLNAKANQNIRDSNSR